ncbi:IstB domain-containing protein ATP-binding protein [Paraburkholderia hospita]|uniref:IstB domain-containing protein ATP-binding protein n=1 Tax=Paraburkholderia hospita TaxID=169430 RepID=A0ABN0FAV0_9BURK|nr:IstB domain-containing protein ATP-binding protein [Paraburkholderia hospita]
MRFFSTIELVNALEQEKLGGKPGQLATRLMYADLVVLDLCVVPRYVESGGARHSDSR